MLVLTLVASVSFPVLACTTFVVGKAASGTGRVLLGHNEDDGGQLLVRRGYVPPRTWEAAERLPCEAGRASIPQVGRTQGFYWIEVKAPAGGLSVADAMYNDSGVVVFSNGAGGCVDTGSDAACLTDGGIYYNVRRAVAERAVSARAAVDVITNLVTTWGYVSDNGRNYVVADRDEAYVVELVRGRTFAARRCPDAEVTIIPNCYTIRTLKPEDVVSDDLRTQPNGFDFARTFQRPDKFKRASDTRRQALSCRELTGADWPTDDYPFSVRPSRKIGVADIRNLLEKMRIRSTVDQSFWTFDRAARDMPTDAGDAAGRLERHFLPEPSAGGCDLGLYLELLRIPSETDDIAACNRATDCLRAWLEKRGVPCTELVTPTGGRRFLYAATTPGLEHDYVFVTHLDVVPPSTDRQFVPRIVGDRVFARGACDTKGNAVVIAETLARLAGTGASVGAVFSTNEESGGGTANTAAYAVRKGVRPRKLVLVGDTTGDNEGLLAVGEKGHVTYRMRAYGRGGHSSVPWLCDNPLPKLMEGYRKVLEAYPPVATQEDPAHDTLSATSVKSSELGNMIADMAELKLSYRYLKKGGREKMAEDLRALTGLEIEAPAGMPPIENDPDDPEIAALYEAMRATLGPKVHKGVFNGATDGVRFVGMGVPIVIFTADSHGAHAADEWCSTTSLHAYADFFSGYFQRRRTE